MSFNNMVHWFHFKNTLDPVVLFIFSFFPIFILPFILSFIYSFIHSFIHLFICLFQFLEYSLTIVANIVQIKDPTESAAPMAIHTVRIVGQAYEIRTYRIGEQTRLRRV